LPIIFIPVTQTIKLTLLAITSIVILKDQPSVVNSKAKRKVLCLRIGGGKKKIHHIMVGDFFSICLF